MTVQQNAVPEPGEEVVKVEEGTETVCHLVQIISRDTFLTRHRSGQTVLCQSPIQHKADSEVAVWPPLEEWSRAEARPCEVVAEVCPRSSLDEILICPLSPCHPLPRLVPLGPRAGVGLPANIPKGPKAGRFKDKDRVEPSSSGGLDYGGGEAGGSERSGSERDSPVKSERKSSRREREHDEPSDGDSRERERSGRRSSRRDDEKEKEKEREREGSKREKRKRDDGTISASLGPAGWESETDDERRSR